MPAKLPIWSARKRPRRMGVEQQGASAPFPSVRPESVTRSLAALRSLGPAALMVEHEDLSEALSDSLSDSMVAGGKSG